MIEYHLGQHFLLLAIVNTLYKLLLILYYVLLYTYEDLHN
jgi:hypothetical protein